MDSGAGKENEIIRLEEVAVKSEEYAILRDVSLSFSRGECTILVGPSGCGKSTLLKAAAGLLVPDQGNVYLDGRNLLRMTDGEMRAFRKKNGFVFQDSALWENRTVYQNLSLPLEYHFPEKTPGGIRERIARVLEGTGLLSQTHLRPAQLSSGERKIVSFLRAVITGPDLLFMDEPTLSVDKKNMGLMYEMIRDFKQRGCTLIVVTHDADLISWLADHLVVLDRGQVVESGPFDSVKNSSSPVVRSILSSVLAEAASYDTDILGLLSEEER